MKKVILICLILSIFICINVCADEREIKVIINGEELICDVPPMLVNMRTMLPLRAILNGLSVPDENIVWWEMAQAVEVKHEGTYLFMAVGSDTAIVDDTAFALDSPAFVLDGRTMVPARFISEALKADVKWDDETYTVHISRYNEGEIL